MDHIGPFVTTSMGNKYILVMVDNFTKFTCLFAAKDTSTDRVMVSLTTFVQMFGLPNRLVTVAEGLVLQPGSLKSSVKKNEYNTH